ncbi:sigma-70 family RNA polymerase sigma factor [Alkalibacter rhizosphaerae]|uniref:Sigma-70 family RNA polymerase sigma factor n=1 Tax=Alkalibacter rhizosphaerae TaxID=2815577 RepID=A0A974XD72_9FIRM|nr:sigma-70 family RNA polymerase sigma factor [Alkalibacter rhizosphaerae]QSX07506.1 sigma-70 family RNA polymerase sigma factor [Alkalibacter rhizosphaerae]
MKGTYDCTKQQDSIHEKEELALLELAAKGDNEAKDMVLRRYSHLVGFAINGYHLIGADQDDLYQEGMIGLLKAVEVYRPDRKASFRTFCQVCIRRQILTAIKRATRKKHGPLNRYVSIYKPLDGDGTMLRDVLSADRLSEPESALMYRQAVVNVKHSLAELTLLERDVLCLHMEGLSYQQIGEALERDPKAIDNALQRCKRKLAKRISGNYSSKNIRNN